VCVLLLGSVVACGQTEFEPGGTGGTPGTGGASAASGGAPGAGAPSAGGAGTGGSYPVPKTECVVAVHADQCCSPAVPVPTTALSADPCLVPYGYEYVADVRAACPAVVRCEAVDCVTQPPPSRIAVPDPTSETGCAFANECATRADCILGSDLRGCCSCPTAYPQALTLVNPCLSPPGPPPDVVCRDVSCNGVACGACPSPTPTAVCTAVLGEYLTCLGVVPT
jgi:hypothetical protein